jgi:hypothetical protein
VITITIPPFLLGNTITLAGTFPVTPAVGAGTGGFAITLQESRDSGATWHPVALGATTQGGYYSIGYQPGVVGNVSYRAFFTGMPETFFQTIGPASPAQAEAYVPPQTKTNGLKPHNITNTYYSPVTPLQIGTLADVAASLSKGINTALSSLSNSTVLSVNNGLCTLQKGLTNSTNDAIAKLSTNFNTALGQLQASSAKSSDVTALTATVNNLSSQVTTLTTVAYASLAVAIILGLAAIALSRRKRS